MSVTNPTTATSELDRAAPPAVAGQSETADSDSVVVGPFRPAGFTWMGTTARIEAHPAHDPLSFTPLPEREADGQPRAGGHEPQARPAPQESATTDRSAEPGAGTDPSFPGGRPRLPRLDGSDPDPTTHFVGSAFVKADTAEKPQTGYRQYFTYESLFEPDSAQEVAEGSHHYAVLGVGVDAEWDEVIAAHRRLVKANHPDHLVDAPCDVRDAAEERLRVINVAYGELRRLRRN